MDEELRKLREDAAMDLSPSSPAVVQANTDFGNPAPESSREWARGGDWGHLQAHSHEASPPSGSSGLHDWELLSGLSAPSSPKSIPKGDQEIFVRADQPPSEGVLQEFVEEATGDQDMHAEDEAVAKTDADPEQAEEGEAMDHDAPQEEEAIPGIQASAAVLEEVQVAGAFPVLSGATPTQDSLGGNGAAVGHDQEEEALTEAGEEPMDAPVVYEHMPAHEEAAAEAGHLAGVSAPSSPRPLRSGTSSFSHISSPASYRFAPSDAEGRHDGGSDASSDNEDDGDSAKWTSSDADEDGGSRQGSRRSEADSEEAIADVVALSQEGSLGSLSDGEPGYARASRQSSLEAVSGTMSFAEVAALSMDVAGGIASPGSPHPPASLAPHSGKGVDNLKSVEEAAAATLRVAEEITIALESGIALEPAPPTAVEERAADAGDDALHPRDAKPGGGSCPEKGERHSDVMRALRAGLDRLAAVSGATLAAVASHEALHRFWTSLQEWALALVACLPAGQRARARLQLELARMRARARRVGWSHVLLAAGLAIATVVAGCALLKNAALSRALRRKDVEMNQLFVMVFKLQESLQGAARVPIMRHASCAMSTTFPLEPASIISF